MLKQTKGLKLKRATASVKLLILGSLSLLYSLYHREHTSQVFDTHSREFSVPTVASCWLAEYIGRHNQVIQTLPKQASSDRFLIFVCDGGCGGIGDRLSGLISSFYLAVATDRIFLVEHTSPALLQDTLEPHAIRWNETSRLPHGLKTLELFAIDSPNPQESYLKISTAAQSEVPVLRIRINRYFMAMILWYSKYDTERIHANLMGKLSAEYDTACGPEHDFMKSPKYTFALGFKILFTFSHAVRHRAFFMYDELGISSSQPYISIHARIGGGAADANGDIGWVDPKRHSLEDAGKFFECAASKEARELPYISTERRVVLFSDNRQLKESEILRRKNIGTVTSTKLFHVDRSTSVHTDTVAAGNLDTYAELYILSRSRCIVGSHSTFSGVAVSAQYPPMSCFSFFDQCDTTDVDFWQSSETLPVRLGSSHL